MNNQRRSPAPKHLGIWDVLDKYYGHKGTGIWLGGVLLAACVLQWIVGWVPEPLAIAQQGAWFKTLSGLLLVCFIAAQWVIALRRSSISRKQRLTLHRFVGCFTPVVYMFHSLQLGHAYLAVLSLLLGVMCLSGLFNPQGGNKIISKALSLSWLTIHIASSIAVVILSIVHVWIAALYR